jgi:hypothetical protein
MTAPATWPASAADLVTEHPGSLAAAVVEAVSANA